MWERLQTLVPEVDNIAVAGDFNSVADPKMDSANNRQVEADLLALVNGMTVLSCTASYRVLYPQERVFTFRGNTTRSRINMIWASADLNAAVEQVQISPMATSDHAAVTATYPVGKLEIGHPPKSVPAWVFKSEEFRPVVASFWEEWVNECAQENLLEHVMTALQSLRGILAKHLRSSYLAHQRTGEFAHRLGELNSGPGWDQTEEEWWVERVEAYRARREWQGEEAGERQRTTRGILKCITDFYCQLLTEESADMAKQDVWRHMERWLDLESTCKLEGDIRPDEVERAMAELPRLKVPSLDGMPVKLFEDFRNFFVTLLTAAYNEALRNGSFPHGFADAYVVLLYKKGAKKDVCSWQPISIRNALHKTLLKEVNRVRSDKSQITRSVRQGCPLSPALYVIYIEPMHEILRADERLISLKAGPTTELQSTAFADDAGAVIPSTTRQLGILKEDLATFCIYSRACVNWQKSKAIFPLEVEPTEGWDILIVTEGERMAFLGASLTPSYGSVEEMAIRPTAAVTRFKAWSARGTMGVFGKALVIKNSVLATLWFTGAVHMLGRSMFRYLRKAVHAHLWPNNAEADDFICRVAWNKLVQPRRVGGLGVSDPRLQIITLQLRQIRCRWWPQTDDSAILLGVLMKVDRSGFGDLMTGEIIRAAVLRPLWTLRNERSRQGATPPLQAYQERALENIRIALMADFHRRRRMGEHKEKGFWERWGPYQQLLTRDPCTDQMRFSPVLLRHLPGLQTEGDQVPRSEAGL
ncbi:hypothetical protein CBR_g42095 [Chara braunii]|uniref:Reverse transcriptase domain-containing protein n=1 Tax=Chara braunii TaxID=69332 RepID=A0A388LX60_CHABU|nr:hypothetical protein CBR_g42095 [Chara braunii]|eukprot:GBG86812.1 hypothetical protein CBR_g42095 [Chara braunii]